MKETKKILILIPDGVGIKNYLYSNTFKNTSASISLFHNFDKETLSYIGKHVNVELYFEIPVYKESLKEKFLRELIHLSRLKLNAVKVANPTILKFWKSNHNSLKLKLFYFGVTLASKFVYTYKKILKFEKKYNKYLRKNPFYKQVSEILLKYKPDVIFCTHQRALKAPTIFAAANDLGIKTITVIYSWDNLPKARLSLKAEKYLVWSTYMKEELQLFYPEINPESIKITGTPQFEFYMDPKNIIEKEDFYRSYGLDKYKQIICFSGDDILTSPYDPNYLDEIASEIVKYGKTEKYQIIFRRCPVDISGRFDWVVKKYPDLIIEIPPLWNFNSDIWSAVYPTFDDVRLLTSLVYYSDVVINVGSTMAFDFGMFNKPCIFINYDYKPDKNWSVKTIYKYHHFRSMPSKNAVFWLNDRSEIVQVINKAVNQPNTTINEWFKIVANNVETASSNIIKELL